MDTINKIKYLLEVELEQIPDYAPTSDDNTRYLFERFIDREITYEEYNKNRKPVDITEEWIEYCSEKGWDPLASDRQAWISELATYLRGANYAVYYDGVLIALMDDDQIQESNIISQ